MIKKMAKNIFDALMLMAFIFICGWLVGWGASVAIKENLQFYSDKEQCKEYLVVPFSGVTVTDVECE